MNISLGPVESYIAAWLTAMGFIWYFFKQAEESISPARASHLSRAITQHEPKVSFRLHHDVSSIFSAYFGPSPISLKFVFRSFVTTLMFLVICLALWAAIKPARVKNTIDVLIELPNWQIYIFALRPFILNFFADYLSVAETHYMLRFLRNASIVRVCMILILDAAFTFVVFVILYLVYVALFHFVFIPTHVTESAVALVATGPGYIPGLPLWNGNVRMAIANWNVTPDYWIGTNFYVALIKDLFLVQSTQTSLISPGVFFYTTFATSIWLWLFVFASFVSFGLNQIGKVTKFLQSTIDIENRPLRFIALELQIFISLGFALAGIARFLL